nr:pyridine nucleotide-disulfide oxidoreductase [Gammaproteobacteria bacterium]
MTLSRIALLAAVAVLVGAFFALDLGQYLSLDVLKAQQAALDAYTDTHPVAATLVYFLVYVAVTGLSLPGATVMTLAGGAIFGLLWGVVVVSFASTIGATLAFLVSRFLLRD